MHVAIEEHDAFVVNLRGISDNGQRAEGLLVSEFTHYLGQRNRELRHTIDQALEDLLFLRLLLHLSSMVLLCCRGQQVLGIALQVSCLKGPNKALKGLIRPLKSQPYKALKRAL